MAVVPVNRETRSTNYGGFFGNKIGKYMQLCLVIMDAGLPKATEIKTGCDKLKPVSNYYLFVARLQEVR